MPRGGRRPGAGAPKGNFNGVKGGRSPRFVAVYYVLVNHPDRRALAEMLREAGFFPPPSHEFNGDLRGLFVTATRTDTESFGFKAAPDFRDATFKETSEFSAAIGVVDGAP